MTVLTGNIHVKVAGEGLEALRAFVSGPVRRMKEHRQRTRLRGNESTRKAAAGENHSDRRGTD
jgi:hypothetical protein